MADKPSRALVVYGDGLARSIDSSHTHLHSLAARAYCGFLSLSHSPPSESDDARVVREFSELLDASEAYSSMFMETAEVECQEKSLLTTVSERFMGMKTAIITKNSILKSFGSKVGITVVELNGNNFFFEVDLDLLAYELLNLLGFQEGKTLEKNQFDLIFLHVESCEMINGAEIKYVNEVVGRILHIAQPGSEIGSRLHLSVILSYGTVLEDDDHSLSVSSTGYENNSELSMLFPRQSYTMKGGIIRKNIRQHCPMLIAQWQNAVTRKDMVQMFSFKDFKEHGGNLTIPVDRFLHEVAFKLWKSPKYGA